MFGGQNDHQTLTCQARHANQPRYVIADRAGERVDFSRRTRPSQPPHEAIEHHRRALDAFRVARDLSREGWSLRLLGDAYREHNKLEESITACRQALVALDERGYTPELARCLAGLAESLHRTGRIAEAQHSWREALTRFEQIGDPQADDIRRRLST